MASDDVIPVHTIAEQGDLLLEVGSHDKVQLLVSGQVLTAASKVFAALLGPNYLEGQTTRTSLSPQTIALPEDRADDMQLICQLLHGVITPEQLKKISTSDLLGLAIHIEKYDLSVPLQFHSQALLLDALDSSGRSDTWTRKMTALATAAYLMQRPECFKKATTCLATEAIAPSHDLFSATIGGALASPASVMDAIDYKRIKAREHIVFEVPKLFAPPCCPRSGFANCSTGPDLTKVSESFQFRFWPEKRMTVREATENIKKLVGAAKIKCMFHSSRNQVITHGEVEKLAKQLADICEGLCLRCVREGKDLLRKCEDEEHCF